MPRIPMSDDVVLSSAIRPITEASPVRPNPPAPLRHGLLTQAGRNHDRSRLGARQRADDVGKGLVGYRLFLHLLVGTSCSLELGANRIDSIRIGGRNGL